MSNTAIILNIIVLITTFLGRIGTVEINNPPINVFESSDWPNPDISSKFLFGDDCYDFIIIGSGSTGAVIANRLSENKNHKILLLEAGSIGDAITEFPTMAPSLQFTEYNWGYVTEPEQHACLAMVDKRCACPRGKILGGSSILNYMLYTRCNPEDYNRWEALGNPGWSYANVHRYFLKSENFEIQDGDEGYHNTGGYQSINYAYTSNLGYAFISAGNELGYKQVDYNGKEQIGFSRIQATLKQGQRDSVATAFLAPILDRDNLRIVTDALVTKILITPLTKNANGVEYIWKNKKMKAKATKEVIVSAGAINSPQLLMLSGIGPKSHLKDLGIQTLSDLPVGQTMYDHPIFVGMLAHTNLPINSTPSFDPNEVLQWRKTGEGPLSSIGANEAIAFLKVNESLEYPDVELIIRVGTIDDAAKKLLRFTDEFYDKMYSSLDPTTTSFMIIPVLLHPKSKGYLKLKSADPADSPLIYMNYLSDPDNYDVKTFIGGIRKVQELIGTRAFQQYNARLYGNHFVGCEDEYDSDEYWECALRLILSSTFHPTTTCKMGPKNDPNAVVNHQLKVYGIKNLRVADTSVFPIPLSGHPHAAAIMLGEKAADLIKDDWSFPFGR